MDYTLPTWLYRGAQDAILCTTEADARAAIRNGYTDSPAKTPRGRAVAEASRESALPLMLEHDAAAQGEG